ncbi:hypothetical protein JB92DRAFT_3020340, partial [Gautieria morchelliformis]
TSTISDSRSSNTNKYSTVASLALLVYDHVDVCHDQVVSVWNRPRGSFGKILFIWTRYFGLSSLIVAVTILFHGCGGFFWWEAISVTVLIVSVYAVYNNNKRLVYGLAGVCLVTLVVVGVIWALYLLPGEITSFYILPHISHCLSRRGSSPIDGLTGCYAPTTSTLFGLSFAASAVTEIVLCSCMLYKAWITYKYNYGSPLLKVLVEESIFAALLTNTLLFFVAPQGLVLMAVGWEYAVACTMGSRLLLSMFEQASREQMLTDQSRHTPSYLLSDIRTQGRSASHVESPSVLTTS